MFAYLNLNMICQTIRSLSLQNSAFHCCLFFGNRTLEKFSHLIAHYQLTTFALVTTVSGMKTIAFFDFDGTLTKRDTLLDFTRFAFGNLRFLAAALLLLPRAVLVTLNLADRDTVARQFIRHFYKGENIRSLETRASEYAARVIPQLLHPEVAEAFRRHRDNGDEIVVVSASPELWLIPWCKGHGIRLIATRLETRQEVYSGEVTGRRCIGKEKVTRINAAYDLREFDTVFAYGNSDGDLAMLNMADHSYYVTGGHLEDYSPGRHDSNA